jgi:hypothetical protein
MLFCEFNFDCYWLHVICNLREAKTIFLSFSQKLLIIENVIMGHKMQIS